MQDKNGRDIFAFLMLVIAGFFAIPAQASFGDCNSSAYIGQFDARLALEPGFLCVESGRTPVTSEAGTTHIRIIQHLVSDWARRPGAMRSFKQGVDASATAMSRLGGFRISDVTILLVDGFAPGSGQVKEDFGEIAAWTNFAPGGECRITIWLLGSGATASYGASVVSHELFHCVQRSSLSRGQLTSAAALGRSGGGTWWQEGSADWFSTVAVSPPRYMSDRVTSFDNKSPRTALNIMTYDAYVFFAWLGGAHGPSSVMPFLHSMATSSSEAAQRSAMVAALPAAQWLRFAENYMDRRIRDGHGGSIGSTPQTGDTYEWESTRTQRVDLAPFIIKRANIAFRCGRWRVEPRPQKFHSAKAGGSETWGNFPATLDAMDGTLRQFRFVAMNASAASLALQIVGTQEASCQECAATRTIDSCLVGTWQKTSDTMPQWMREHAPSVRITSVAAENNTMTLNADGSFTTGASHASVSVQGGSGDHIGTGSGQLVAQFSGRWSAAGGSLNICPDAGGGHGTTTVTMQGHTGTQAIPVRRPQANSRPYTCTGNSLQMNIRMPGASVVTTIYTRVAGPR